MEVVGLACAFAAMLESGLTNGRLGVAGGILKKVPALLKPEVTLFLKASSPSIIFTFKS